MRIIAGTLRGKRLLEVGESTTRAMMDRVKQRMFDVLQPHLKNARVCDLFCGTGSLGLEALSRGASFCVFNDLGAKPIEITTKNLIACRLNTEEKSLVLNLSFEMAIAKLAQNGEKFDLILVMPPYAAGLAVPAIELILKNKLLAKGGIIAFEHNKKVDETEFAKLGFAVRQLNFGAKKFVFILKHMTPA